MNDKHWRLSLHPTNPAKTYANVFRNFNSVCVCTTPSRLCNIRYGNNETNCRWNSYPHWPQLLVRCKHEKWWQLNEKISIHLPTMLIEMVMGRNCPLIFKKNSSHWGCFFTSIIYSRGQHKSIKNIYLTHNNAVLSKPTK